jgi:hypothetical protein
MTQPTIRKMPSTKASGPVAAMAYDVIASIGAVRPDGTRWASSA